MSKGKRRREARRRARQRREDQPAERPPQEGDVAAEAAGPAYEESPGREEEAVPSAAEAGHGRAARKRAKRGEVGSWERVRSLRVPSWLIMTPVMVIAVGVLAYLILSSGSSGVTGGGSSATPTPDPRVAGTPVADTIEIVAGDDGPANPAAASFFQPSTITAKAGEVIEIEVKNEGSVTHNIWLAGVDEEYGTNDDWGPIGLIRPGETGRLLVGIDEPGRYSFQCEIHPNVQFGTLTLE